MKNLPLLAAVFIISVVSDASAQKEPASKTMPDPDQGTTRGWAISAGPRFGKIHADFSAKLGTTEVEPDGTDNLLSGYLELTRQIFQSGRTRVSLFGSYAYGTASFSTGEQAINEFPVPGDEVYTITDAEIDVDLHQIQLGLEVATDLGGGFELGLAGGPVIHFADSQWRGTSEDFLESTLGFVGGRDADASKSDTVVGAAIEARLRYNFPGDKIFVQVGAGYSWSPDADISNAGVTTKVELNTWTVSASVGIRF